jgi:hypothetical protein
MSWTAWVMTTFDILTPFGGEWRCLERRPYT